jgi:hypothetical protein
MLEVKVKVKAKELKLKLNAKIARTSKALALSRALIMQTLIAEDEIILEL